MGEHDREQSAAVARKKILEDGGNDKLEVTATYAELEAAIPEVAAMKGMDQHSDYHTLTLDEHTKQLGRNLEADPFVQQLPERIRDLLLLAGKLHDLGKTSPDGSQIHPKDPDKRQYLGHEDESKRMATAVLARHFDLQPAEAEFVQGLAGMHASALNMIASFEARFPVGDDGERAGEMAGKDLKPWYDFVAKVNDLPGKFDLPTKMKIIFSLNRADKGAGTNADSDPSDPKVQSIITKAEKQIAAIDQMVKATQAILDAIAGKEAGDQRPVITLVDGVYAYKQPEVKEKKVEIPPELRKLGSVLRQNMLAVAEVYPKLQKASGNSRAMEGIVERVLKSKIGLDESQIEAVLATLKD